MTTTKGTGAVAAAALVLMAACGGDGAPSGEWAGEVLDSAGIQVVMNPAGGMWGDTPGWRLEEIFRVGGLEADATAQFAVIIGIDTDDQGRIYVADQQTREIHVYEGDGTPVVSFGSPGEGPGELGLGVAGVFVSDGEIRVPDVGNQRISIFDMDGEYLRSTPFLLSGGVPIRWDEDGAGRLVVQLRGIPVPGIAAHEGGDPLVALNEGDVPPDTLAFLPPGLSTEFTEGGLPKITVFAPEPGWDVGPDGRLVMAMNSQYRIQTWRDGSLERVLALDWTPDEVTEMDQRRMDGMMRRVMADQGAPPPLVDQMINTMEYAESYPAFAQLLAGPDNTLWVQQIQNLSELAEQEEFNLLDLGSQRWHVFDEDGRFMGELDVPDRFQPYRLLDGVMYGIQRDEFDVPSVVGFRLVAT